MAFRFFYRQQGFVNSGANQQARAESGVAGGYSNLINVATGAGKSLANLYTGQAQQSAADSGGFTKGGLNILSSGAGNFAGSSTGKGIDKSIGKWFS